MSSAQSEKILTLKKQVEKLLSQKDTLLKELDSVETRFENTNKLYKKYFPVIIDSLVTGDNSFSRTCLDLSRALKEGSSQGKIEYIFEQLKTAMLKEDVGDAKEVKKKGLFSAFRKDSAQSFIEIYKKSYFEIINQLRSSLDKKYTGKLDSLYKQIASVQDTGDISDIREGVFKLVFTYISDTGQDREKVNAFVKEIVSKIFDIESMLNSSFESTDSLFLSSDEFETALNLELSGLKKSKDAASDLDGLKEQIAKRLAAIEQALEKKQLKDKAVKKIVEKTRENYHSGFLRLKRKLDEAVKHSEELEAKLNRDQLTGAYNRRAYDLKINDEMERYLRYGTVFSLLLMDADKFKAINDNYGHAVGDRCLKEIIKRTMPLLRKPDMLARYGGEEFVVIMPGTDAEGGRQAAEKIRQTIEKIEFLYKNKKVKVTISIGVSQTKEGDKNGAAVFERADIAVYQAKEQGRNRVVVN